MSHTRNICAVFATALLASVSAQAETVDLREVGPNTAVVSEIYINGGDFNGNVTGYIGAYTVATQSPAGSFAAYCVDPFQHSNSNFQQYNRSPLVAANLPPVEATRFAAVSKLFGNAYAGSLASTAASASFQIALWEVWHDDGNVESGNIHRAAGSVSGIFDNAQTLIGSIGGMGPGTPYTLTLYANNSYQDYVTAVPEPETQALMLAGLGLLGFAARRRNKTAAGGLR